MFSFIKFSDINVIVMEERYKMHNVKHVQEFSVVIIRNLSTKCFANERRAIHMMKSLIS